MSQRAIVLIAHGSPDPDWAAPLREVVNTMRQSAPEARVELALLTEPDSFESVLSELRDAGHQRVEVVAALLSAGGKHLKRDIPAWVEQARARFPELELELRPGALGARPAVIQALARAALDEG